MSLNWIWIIIVVCAVSGLCIYYDEKKASKQHPQRNDKDAVNGDDTD